MTMYENIESIETLKMSIILAQKIYKPQQTLYSSYEEIIESLDEAIEALNRQTPKQPVKIVARKYICPTCQFSSTPATKYCNRCGQCLDWSGVYDEVD